MVTALPAGPYAHIPKMSKQFSIAVAVLEWGMYCCRALMFVLNCFNVTCSQYSFLGLTHGGIRGFCILVGFSCKSMVCSRGEGAVSSVREWETTTGGLSCTASHLSFSSRKAV